MHRIKYLLGLLLFSLIALIAISCVSTKNAIITDNSLSLTGNGTSEGIVIHFYNIPENTVLLTITIEDNTENNQIQHSALFWNTVYFPDFTREVNDLAKLKETQNLLFPFSKEGHRYTITAHVSTDINNLDDRIEYSIVVLSTGGKYLPDNILNFAGMHLLTYENIEWTAFIGIRATPTPLL